jgi:tripartite-type tricarboxylate transporter receptor subunit TctC
MFKTQHTLRKAVCALGVSALLAGMPVIGHAWEPQKPVEFVVMAGKGGGADKAVRLSSPAVRVRKRWYT